MTAARRTINEWAIPEGLASLSLSLSLEGKVYFAIEAVDMFLQVITSSVAAVHEVSVPFHWCPVSFPYRSTGAPPT